ncbi:hypothetical protein LTR70_004839 [Exophiala xenobiotica]|uniref:Uncharacterized protein n=1 Tax=Lithohypha guttulata TaxID=1690604 RepID=A0ABR0KDP0_9EURO|nr:hypothetical protein LTR24_004457 [Lithohypha guttulata]KAK5319795.1 hypothetical protein LTR70_004839 [Exophiala xenobiotica]
MPHTSYFAKSPPPPGRNDYHRPLFRNPSFLILAAYLNHAGIPAPKLRHWRTFTAKKAISNHIFGALLVCRPWATILLDMLGARHKLDMHEEQQKYLLDRVQDPVAKYARWVRAPPYQEWQYMIWMSGACGAG